MECEAMLTNFLQGLLFRGRDRGGGLMRAMVRVELTSARHASENKCHA